MKTHPVIKHLLARKNKKVPVKDGRKIVLVLCGGAMAGIRGAGFLIALKELGLDNAFDEIYALFRWILQCFIFAFWKRKRRHFNIL